MRTNTSPVTVVIVTGFAGARVSSSPTSFALVVNPLPPSTLSPSTPRSFYTHPKTPCPRRTRETPHTVATGYRMLERVMESQRDGREREENEEGARDWEREREDLKGDARSRQEATVVKVTGQQNKLTRFFNYLNAYLVWNCREHMFSGSGENGWGTLYWEIVYEEMKTDRDSGEERASS